MKCTECAEGKRITSEKILCIQYGMIIRDNHECSRPGARKKEDPPVLPTPTEQIGGPQDEP